VNNSLLATLDQITEFLASRRIQHCPIGGLAVGARAQSATDIEEALAIDLVTSIEKLRNE